jgi:hypothetical protein
VKDTSINNAVTALDNLLRWSQEHGIAPTAQENLPDHIYVNETAGANALEQNLPEHIYVNETAGAALPERQKFANVSLQASLSSLSSHEYEAIAQFEDGPAKNTRSRSLFKKVA